MGVSAVFRFLNRGIAKRLATGLYSSIEPLGFRTGTNPLYPFVARYTLSNREKQRWRDLTVSAFERGIRSVFDARTPPPAFLTQIGYRSGRRDQFVKDVEKNARGLEDRIANGWEQVKGFAERTADEVYSNIVEADRMGLSPAETKRWVTSTLSSQLENSQILIYDVVCRAYELGQHSARLLMR